MRYYANNIPDVADLSVDTINTYSNRHREHAAQLADMISRAKDNTDGGIYLASIGVAYALHRAATCTQLHDDRQEKWRAEAMRRLHHTVPQYEKQAEHDAEDTSLMFGGCGAYMVAALIANDKAAQYCEHIDGHVPTLSAPSFRESGSDEMCVGRAGWLCAVAVLRRALRAPVVDDSRVLQIIRTTLNSGRAYAARRCCRVPLMYAYYDTEYLGPAHGLAGILQMLLNYPDLLKNADTKAWDDVKSSVDWLLSIQDADGNWPAAATDSAGRNELVHWCHGAGGVIYCMAAAYLAYGRQDKYLQSCLKSGELVWNRGLLQKGPGICHGVAGGGYAFLLLYRLTNDRRWLARAHAFALYMFDDDQFHTNSFMKPDNPLSLHEGLAGTLCFLLDLLTPDTAEFPLVPISAL